MGSFHENKASGRRATKCYAVGVPVLDKTPANELLILADCEIEHLNVTHQLIIIWLGQHNDASTHLVKIPFSD